jgi:hypothetical protein
MLRQTNKQKQIKELSEKEMKIILIILFMALAVKWKHITQEEFQEKWKCKR